MKIFTKKKVVTNLVVRRWIGGKGGLVGKWETVSHLLFSQVCISKFSPTITRSTHSLLVAAHENTGPNYRKDVLQMLDMLTWPLHTGPGCAGGWAALVARAGGATGQLQLGLETPTRSTRPAPLGLAASTGVNSKGSFLKYPNTRTLS